MPAPTPTTPTDRQIALDTLAAITSMQAQIILLTSAVQAQAEDLGRLSNYARLAAETHVGPNPGIVGVWDGTQRYTP